MICINLKKYNGIWLDDIFIEGKINYQINKDEYDSLRNMRTQTSVYNVKINFTKNSLFDLENIKEEISFEERVDGSVGSDYENEENENSDKEKKINFVNNKKDIKKSVFVAGFKSTINKKRLKQSVQDNFIRNKLRDKLYKSNRTN